VLAVFALAVLGLAGHQPSALALSASVTVVLIMLAVWDHEHFRPQSEPFAWKAVGCG
jgi:hypothetical protein